ncbi:hypothetical protein D3C76_839600 [compost metagenome]
MAIDQLVHPGQRQRHDARRERTNQQCGGAEQAQVMANQQHRQGCQLRQQHQANAGTCPQVVGH